MKWAGGATQPDYVDLREPLDALELLLSVTKAHRNLPIETSASLEEMASRVRQLSSVVALLDHSDVGDNEDRARAERLPTTLREIVGDDILDGLAQGAQTGLDASKVEGRLDPGRLPRLVRQLTPQEQRILDLIAQGCTNRQIAAHLFLAEKTVKNYVSNLLRKLGMERRTQAAVYAVHLGRPSLAISASASVA